MKKITKGIMGLCAVGIACVGLVGCGAREPVLVFQKTNFTEEQSGFSAVEGETASLGFEDGNLIIPEFEYEFGVDHGFYTEFDEYRSEFPKDGYTTKLTVYIDPTAIDAGQGFTYTSVINDKNGNYLTEQMTHIRKISENDAKGKNHVDVPFDYSEQLAGKILISSTNRMVNSNVVNPVTGNIEYDVNSEITVADWYTISTTYTIVNNKLSATVKVTNSSNTTIFNATPNIKANDRPDSDYAKTNVGGNRCGWFVENNITSGIKVKEISIYNV